MTATRERAHAVTGLDRLVLALDPLREHRANEPLLIVRLTREHVPVHRPSVVGIDEVEAPPLVALVDVRHARRSELQERLGQGDFRSERREPPREPGQRLVRSPGEVLYPPLVRL